MGNPKIKIQLMLVLPMLALLAIQLVPLAIAQSTVPQFAQSITWTNLVYLALVTGTLILAIAYGVGHMLGNEALKTWSRDELFQILLTAVLVVLVVYFVQNLDSYTTGLLTLTGLPSTSATTLMGAGQEYALNALNTARHDAGEIRGAAVAVGREASKSGYCTFLGVGYYVPTCSAYNSVRGGLGIALQAAIFAVWDLEGQYGILLLAQYVAFVFLLPIGVFLRSFNATRKFGGALMAIAIGFYVVFPAMLIFDEVVKSVAGTNSVSVSIPSPSCDDPYSYDRSAQLAYARGISSIAPDGPVIPLMQDVLVNAVLLTLVNLMVTLTAIKGISGLLGSELEVFWIARLS